jgi:DNA repair exonuclease SbcCD ATPase subunit
MSIYLQKVRITEFRPYGEAFELELPAPGPGVTILVGPNGLGKSALFEAIEWSLTGRVERLERIPSDRGRRGAYGRILEGRKKPFTSRVELQYSGPMAATVQRSSSYGANGESLDEEKTVVTLEEGATQLTGAAGILRVLKDPAWPLDVAEDSLSAYLRTTHILAQSTAVRLTSQEPKQRWSSLSQLNGAGLLDRAQQRLLSRSTTAALDEEIQAATLRVSALQEHLERSLELLEARDSLAAQATAEGALGPDDAFAVLRQLLPQRQAVVGETVEAMLEALRVSLQSNESQLTTLLSQLESNSQLPIRFAEALAQGLTAQSAVAASERARDAATELVERAKTNLASATSIEQTTAAELRLIESAETKHRQWRDAVTSLQNLERQAVALIKTVESTQQAISAADATLAQLQPVLTHVQGLHIEQRRRTEALASLRALKTDTETHEKRTDRVRLAQTELLGKHAELDAANAALTKARERSEEAVRAKQSADAIAEAVRNRADVQSQALGALAALIDETDHSCPVCQSEFPNGILKERAIAAARTANAEVATAEAAVQAAERAAATALIDALELQNTTSRLRESTSALEAELAAHHAAEQELQQRVAAKGLSPNTKRAIAIENALQVETEATAEIRSRIDAEPALDKVRQDAADVAERTQQLRAELAAAQQQLDALGTRRRDYQLTISELGQSEQDNQTAERNAAKAVTLQTLAVTSESRSNCEAALARATEAAESAQRDADIRRASVATLNAQLDACRRSWRDLLLDGDPHEDTLASASQRAIAERATVVARLERLSDIGRRYTAWGRQQELAQKQLQVVKLLNQEQVTAESGIERQIRRRIEEAKRAQLKRLQAKQCVERFKSIIKDVASDYFDQVVAPLNLLERGYAEAITVRTPFTVEWATRLAYGKTHLDLQGRFSGGKELVSAPHVLSEGQLAATAFTQLVSLSTAYRWSRWRALLLDDPVQHNDVLHVSAFVDLLRNLVRQQGYQVILSTHDPEIAEFLARKFRIAGVSLATCWFQGITDVGVRYRVQEG